jgi:transposase InsO family protein
MDTADSDLPDAAVEHISQMLTLAKSKHQEAMALLGTPDPNALPRLREVLRRTHRYKSIRDDPVPLLKRIKEIAETRVRYGYRRIHILLRREG